MAYQLPPPPHHDDPNVRAWLFEVWKRNQDILDSSATIQIIGDVTAPATGSTNKQFVLPSTLNLDLICAIDGGDSASTYTGADFPFHSIYGKATIDTSPLSGSWAEIEHIRDIQTDGTNILIAGEKPNNESTLWKTDHTLASVTEIATYKSGGDFSNYSAFRYLEFLEYIPSLDRWIISTEQGDIYYSNDIGATWTASTLPVGWNIQGADIGFMNWNPSLGYIHVGSADSSVMPVSTDGITWVDQSTLQALSSPHQYRLYWAGTLEYGASKKTHILSHWETYSWKDEDTGGSTGWTKTTNNGVVGGAGGTWTIMGWDTDGTTTVCYAFGSLSANADPTIHGDWQEYDWTALGLGGNYNIYGLMYIPEYDRPWVMAVDDSAGANKIWYDAATITTGGAPTFAVSTNTDLVGKALPVTPKWNSRGGRMKRTFGDNWAIIFEDSAAGGGAVDTILIGRAN